MFREAKKEKKRKKHRESIQEGERPERNIKKMRPLCSQINIFCIFNK
jgi:hypothetical protein